MSCRHSGDCRWGGGGELADAATGGAEVADCSDLSREEQEEFGGLSEKSLKLKSKRLGSHRLSTHPMALGNVGHENKGGRRKYCRSRGIVHNSTAAEVSPLQD